MRIPISLFTIALSCVLSRSASINWTNHVANIQAETNAYVGTSVNIGAGFADARIYPDSGPAVTPFRLQSTALRLAGNIFEVSNGPGFLILSLDYTGLLSAPDLLLTGDASVQGAVLTDHVVATNGVVTGGLTNTSVSQLQGTVTANQITSTNSATFQAGFTSDSGTITNTLTVKGDAQVAGTVRAGGLVSTNAATVNNLVATNGVYTGGQTNIGVTVHTPSAIQTLAAGTVIAWDSSTERVAGSGGAVTLTGTPTIQTNNVPDGALITIRGTSDANTVTLQDYRLITGTCIAMEMGSVTLMNGSEIRFQWSAANQKWQQVAFSANSGQNHKFANATIQTNLTVGGTGGGSLIVTNGATANVPLIVNQAASASVDSFQVNSGGTNRWSISSTGNLVAGQDNAYNIGATSSTLRPANVYAAGTFTSGGNHYAGATAQFGFSGRSYMSSPADGQIKFSNDGSSGFTGLALGPDVASPTSPYIRAGSGSGTDKTGGSLTIEGGASTGTGTGGTLYHDTSMTAEASGSTLNAFQHRYAAPAGFVALTHATATTIATFSLAANKVIGGHICSTVWATNNVPHLQSITSDFDFAAICTGTTIVPTLGTPNSTPQAVDSGTLTLTGYTAVDNGNNTFSIKVNVSSDLASPTERCRFVVTTMNGSDAVTFSSP